MHIEWNICASLLGYILGEKDTIQVRADLQETGAMPYLHFRQRGPCQTYLKPYIPYVLADFLQAMGQIRVPIRYSAQLGLHVSEKKLQD
jgi:hypothetical protein